MPDSTIYRSAYTGVQIDDAVTKASKLIDTNNYTYSSSAERGLVILKDNNNYGILPPDRIGDYLTGEIDTSEITVSSDLNDYTTLQQVAINEPLSKAVAMVNLLIQNGGGGGGGGGGSETVIVHAPARRVTRNDQALVQQMINVAETYRTASSWTYGGKHNMSYGNTTNLETSTTNNLDCSAYVGLVLRGINFNQTCYVSGHPEVDPSTLIANSSYIWAFNPQYYNYPSSYYYPSSGSSEGTPGSILTKVRSAAQLADWMVDMGWEVSKDSKLINLEVGDVLFFAKKDSNQNWVQPSRFMHISHVGICYEKAYAIDPNNTPSWVTSTFGFSDWFTNSRYNDFPICHRIIHCTGSVGVDDSCIKLSMVEKYYDISATAAAARTGYQTLCLICRPDLGALKINS